MREQGRALNVPVEGKQVPEAGASWFLEKPQQVVWPDRREPSERDTDEVKVQGSVQRSLAFAMNEVGRHRSRHCT